MVMQCQINSYPPRGSLKYLTWSATPLSPKVRTLVWSSGHVSGFSTLKISAGVWMPSSFNKPPNLALRSYRLVLMIASMCCFSWGLVRSVKPFRFPFSVIPSRRGLFWGPCVMFPKSSLKVTKVTNLYRTLVFLKCPLLVMKVQICYKRIQREHLGCKQKVRIWV